VKIVDRLHAKVLIIDEENAFFGSQNFTNYSTESIEITTQVNRYVDKVEDFFNYFEELLEGARYVTVDELNEAAGSRRYVSSDDTEINIDAISEVDLDEWLLEIDDDD
jgi:hypothetical protein